MRTDPLRAWLHAHRVGLRRAGWGVLGFNLLGDGLQDILDPRRKVSAR